MITNHAQTYTALLLSSKSNRSAKKNEESRRKNLGWHDTIFPFSYTHGMLHGQGRQMELKIRSAQSGEGQNLIPESWGNFPGQGRSISNFWGNKWQKSPKFLGRFEPWKVEAQTLLWGGAWGKNKQCMCTGCTAQFGALVYGDQSSNIVNNSFKNNNFIVSILAYRILWW